VVTPYQVVSIIPGWASTPFVDPATKLDTGFVASFNVPAPPGGSTFDWEILAPTAAAVSLAQYLDCLRDILHDPDDEYWPLAKKTDYINQGLQKRDRETGQNRVLIPFVTTIGQDTYNFTQLGNVNVFDLISVNLLYNNLRYVMGAAAYSVLNATIRQYNPPFAWAPTHYTRYGPSQFIVAPAPSIAYTLEVDCAQITPRGFLVSLTDTDMLPAPYDAPVCYWAARMAKYNERAYDEAREFEDDFNVEVNRLDSNKVGMVPSLYSRGMGR
jgi:hypothetical protein